MLFFQVSLVGKIIHKLKDLKYLKILMGAGIYPHIIPKVPDNDP